MSSPTTRKPASIPPGKPRPLRESDRRRLRRAGDRDRLARRDRLHRPWHDAGPERLFAAARRKGDAAGDPGRGRHLSHRAAATACVSMTCTIANRTPLVPRGDIVEVPGRLTTPAKSDALDENAIRAAARRYREKGLGSIAIAFLFCYHQSRARTARRRDPDARSSARSRSRCRTGSRRNGANTSARPPPSSRPTRADRAPLSRTTWKSELRAGD